MHSSTSINPPSIMSEYVIFLQDGNATTITADSFTKTRYEVLFFEGEVPRKRNDQPQYEDAVAAFTHDKIAGFAKRTNLSTNE